MPRGGGEKGWLSLVKSGEVVVRPGVITRGPLACEEVITRVPSHMREVMATPPLEMKFK